MSTNVTQASPPPVLARKKPKRRNRATPYLLLIPAVFFELWVHIIPMLFGLWISLVNLSRNTLTNWTAAKWNNFHNYVTAVSTSPTGPALLRSFMVTALYTVCVVGLAWTFGMAAAVVLNRSFRGQRWFRTLFLIPYALPVYAGVLVWNFMFQRQGGAVNYILMDNLHVTGLLKALHLVNDFQLQNGGGPFWLSSSNAGSFIALVVTAVWRSWPFCFLMIMAGLQSIPNDIYEAGELDGAGWVRQWKSLTLPMLRPVNTTLLLVLFLWTFNDFNTPFVLFGISADAGGDLVSYHIYTAAFAQWHVSWGAAMSTVLLLFLLVVTVIYLSVINRRSRRA